VFVKSVFPVPSVHRVAAYLDTSVLRHASSRNKRHRRLTAEGPKGVSVSGGRPSCDTGKITPNKIGSFSAGSHDARVNLTLHSRVQIHGLHAKMHLNGQSGTVSSLDADRRRWNIQLDVSKKIVAVKPANIISIPTQDQESSASCFSVEDPASNSPEVWCPSAFQVAQGLDIDHELMFKENTTCDGPFVAFGDVVCSERYILWQAHICNRSFRRAPVNLQKMYEFPHMTLAKLEHGYAERQANRSTDF
jgi:hypothetical protein